MAAKVLLSNALIVMRMALFFAPFAANEFHISSIRFHYIIENVARILHADPFR